MDIEVVARAIHLTEPDTWPASRRRALDEYLSAVMYTLLAPSRHQEINTWLLVIAQIGMDVRPHLHAIEQSTEAVLDYFSNNSRDLPQRELADPSWKQCPEGHEAIVAWFYSRRIRKIVFDAYGYVLPAAE